MCGNKRVVLVAAIGVSPAVLTETIWAMAHRPKPVVPDKITVVTTATGRKSIEEKMLSGKPSVWDDLLKALKAEKIDVPAELRFGRTSIIVVPDDHGDEAVDLRSSGDNMRAADTMLETIRKYTEDPRTIVYASIAGGRKSMGALMLSCMSLLGRSEDRVTHVLTSPDVIGMKSLKDGSEFFFPKRGHTYAFGSDKRQKIVAGKISIEMFDVPFVRMRGWYQEKFRELPTSYGMLVNAVQQEAPASDVIPEVSLDLKTGIVMIGDKDCPVGKCGTALLYCYMTGAFAQEDLVSRLGAFGALIDLPDEQYKNLPKWVRAYMRTKRSGRGGMVDEDDISRMASELRIRLARRLPNTLVERLCPKYDRAVSYPMSKMLILNQDAMPELEEGGI